MPVAPPLANVGAMSGNSLQLASAMIVTVSAGWMMLFAGTKKRQLRWRTNPRERRRRNRR
jgi:hypothetical protein